MSRLLEGRIAVVTGVRGALGAAVRQRFDELGATVIGIARSAEGTGVLGADLADSAACERVAAEILARHGRIDALLNVAGGFALAPATELGSWDELWKMNLVTAMHMSRAVLPSMTARGAGTIVNVAGRVQPAGAQMAAYAAAKSAVLRLTEALAEETKERGVRVNCVVPSILDTEANRRAMPQADASRWVTPAALADAMAFLCSDLARAVTGASLPVYGRA